MPEPTTSFSNLSTVDLLSILDKLQEKSADMLLAEQRLREALETSVEICEKVEKLVLIRQKLVQYTGSVDMDLERRRFFESNIDAYFKWASGEGKFPSSKALDSIENDAKIALLASEHVNFRLAVLDPAAKLSRSEELTNHARILTLRSQ